MKTVALFGSCPASGEITLATPRISMPYTVQKIKARFPQGCQNMLKLRFYVSPDADCPAVGKPNGHSMLSDYGQVDYIVGDQDSKSIEHETEVEESGSFLKVYAENSDTFVHAIDVQITIDDKERRF